MFSGYNQNKEGKSPKYYFASQKSKKDNLSSERCKYFGKGPSIKTLKINILQFLILTGYAPTAKQFSVSEFEKHLQTPPINQPHEFNLKWLALYLRKSRKLY